MSIIQPKSVLIYYSKFAKDHSLEACVPGCDCITWVTHKLLTVVAAGN